MKATKLRFRLAGMLFAVALVSCFGIPAMSSAAELAGLKVGEKGPSFELQNQSGQRVKLAELLQKGPVALVFYRSADW